MQRPSVPSALAGPSAQATSSQAAGAESTAAQLVSAVGVLLAAAAEHCSGTPPCLDALGSSAGRGTAGSAASAAGAPNGSSPDHPPMQAAHLASLWRAAARSVLLQVHIPTPPDPLIHPPAPRAPACKVPCRLRVQSPPLLQVHIPIRPDPRIHPHAPLAPACEVPCRLTIQPPPLLRCRLIRCGSIAAGWTSQLKDFHFIMFRRRRMNPPLWTLRTCCCVWCDCLLLRQF